MRSVDEPLVEVVKTMARVQASAEHGAMVEWSMASRLKREGWKRPVGSNPTCSANLQCISYLHFPSDKGECNGMAKGKTKKQAKLECWTF